MRPSMCFIFLQYTYHYLLLLLASQMPKAPDPTCPKLDLIK